MNAERELPFKPLVYFCKVRKWPLAQNYVGI
jgi:hypothetical protein